MTEKRKNKKRKEEDFDFETKEVVKPTKDEEKLAKWMKKNISPKKTKFAGHIVEYFTGSKAVDTILQSEWCKQKNDAEPFFGTRQDIVNFLNNMLRHKMFHRAKKVPVSIEELIKIQKRKDKNSQDEKKKKKEDDVAEISHIESKDVEDKKQNDKEKKCKKIRLEMHFEQVFVDNLDAYVWLYNPTPFYYWIVGFFVLIGAVAICLFPLWPPAVRTIVQYISIGAAGLLIIILGLAVIRLIVFCLIWLITFGKLHLWLLPNLTEDVGFFASFWPLYEYKYGNEIGSKKKKKKKVKYSDNEDEAVDKKKNTNKNNENYNDDDDDDEDDSDSVSHSESEQNIHKKYDGADDKTIERDLIESSNHGEEGFSENHSSVENSPNSYKIKKSTGFGRRRSFQKNDYEEGTEETDTESSSQHSQTGKDFEFVEKEDNDLKA